MFYLSIIPLMTLFIFILIKCSQKQERRQLKEDDFSQDPVCLNLEEVEESEVEESEGTSYLEIGGGIQY